MSRDILLNTSKFTIKSTNINEKLCKDNSKDNLLTILSQENNIISIEICPGKEFNTELLQKLNPKFCSVPWLGHPNLENPVTISSIKLAKNLQNKGYNTLLHLAGRNFKKENLRNVLNEIKNCEIRNIFAIQGDWQHVEQKIDTNCDFPYAADMVSFIRENYGNYFCIGVAGYPDKHPHSASKKEDLSFLKMKVDSGADFIITQGVYEYSTLESFIKSCRILKIDVPILPGIFIANSYKSLTAIRNICQVNVPDKMLRSYEILQKNSKVLENYGVSLTANLLKQVFDGKLCPGIHIFSLNNLEIVEKVVTIET